MFKLALVFDNGDARRFQGGAYQVAHTFQADVDYMCTGESKERQLQFTNGLC